MKGEHKLVRKLMCELSLYNVCLTNFNTPVHVAAESLQDCMFLFLGGVLQPAPSSMLPEFHC